MRPLTGFADLAGLRVGIFGYGVEGHAAAERLEGVAGELVLVDDAEGTGGDVLVNARGGHDALATCDVVLKSPGIPRRRADVLALEARGVTITSALNLWLHEVALTRVVAVTGTKGKSTTTSLITFFLRCLGEDAQSLGNIGEPPYRRSVDSSTGWLVVEVSSFQCVDVDVAPGHVVVTSLGADHLDWHGSLDQYVEDKLSLTRAPGPHRTLVPDTDTFHRMATRFGGDVRYVAPEPPGLSSALGLLGRHSDSNVALALTTVASLTRRPLEEVRDEVTRRGAQFVALRGRLTTLGSERVGSARVRYVDDGLATSPLPTIAALEVFADEPVVLIAGGFDRGVDYGPLAGAVARRPLATLVVTMGDAGRRLAAALAEVPGPVDVRRADSMDDAVAEARRFLRSGGVVLFSPGAPSFDRYRNWEERSDDFERAVSEQARGWSLGGDSNP